MASLRSLYTDMRIEEFKPLIDAFSAGCARIRKQGFKLQTTAFNANYSWMRKRSFEPATILAMVVQYPRRRAPRILANRGHTIMSDTSGSIRMLATSRHEFEPLAELLIR